MNICHSLNSILVSSAELPCPVRLPFKEVSQLFLAAFCKLDGFGTYLFIAVSIERQSGHKSSSLPCIYRVYLNIYRDDLTTYRVSLLYFKFSSKYINLHTTYLDLQHYIPRFPLFIKSRDYHTTYRDYLTIYRF